MDRADLAILTFIALVMLFGALFHAINKYIDSQHSSFPQMICSQGRPAFSDNNGVLILLYTENGQAVLCQK